MYPINLSIHGQVVPQGLKVLDGPQGPPRLGLLIGYSLLKSSLNLSEQLTRSSQCLCWNPSLT